MRGPAVLIVRAAPRRALITLTATALLISAATAQPVAWRRKLEGQGMTVGINPLNPDAIIAETGAGLLSISHDGGSTWQNWSDCGISGVRQILVHPVDTNTVFAAASGNALRRTTNYGASWVSVLPDYGINGESMAFDPGNPETIYAGEFSTGQVYRSTNRGTNWSLMGVAGTGLCAVTVRPDSTNIIYAGSGGGTISRSTDSGVSWTLVKDGSAAEYQEIPKIVVNAAAPELMYASCYGAVDASLDVWKSTNGGVTWFRTALQALPNWALAIHPTDPLTVYAGTFGVEPPDVLKTTDGGETWESIRNGLPAGSSIWTLRVHPLDPDVLLVAATMNSFGINGIYRLAHAVGLLRGALLDDVTGDTVRNGYVRQTLTGDVSALTESDPVFEIGFFEGDPAPPQIMIEAYAWPYAVLTHPQAPLAETLDVTLNLTELSRASITATIIDSATSLPIRGTARLAITALIGDTVVTDTAGPDGIFSFDSLYVTEDSVNGYTGLVLIPDIPYSSRSSGPFRLTADTAVTLETTRADVMLVSAFDGALFAPFYTSAFDSLSIRYALWDVEMMGEAPLSRGSEFLRNTILYYTGTHLDTLPPAHLDSIDAAIATGVNVLLTGQNILENNASHPLFAQTIGVGYGGNSSVVLHTGLTAGPFAGLSFFSTGSGAGNQTSRDILTATSPDAIPALTYGAATGPVSAIRREFTATDSRVLVAGFGFEAIHTRDMRENVIGRAIGYLDGTLVDVDDPFGGGPGNVPSAYALHQNYPNPFNPSTAISYDLPVRSEVRLTATDILGREIVIDEGVREAGPVHLTWNAGTASGVYLLRLTATPVGAGPDRSFSAVRKMLLLR